MKALFLVLLFCAVLVGLAWKVEAVTNLNDCAEITESGEYSLTNNIFCSNINSTGACFPVYAADVVIDGQGFQTSCDGSVYDIYCVNGYDCSNLIIKNINISNFCEGLDAYYNPPLFNLQLFNNNITEDNCDSIALRYTINASIHDNIFAPHNNDGIYLLSNDNISFYENYFSNEERLYILNNLNQIVFWNNSIVGNFWVNYSDSCIDADLNGICDVPYNVTTGTGCTAGVDCGDNTDYLPLACYPYSPGGCLQQPECEPDWSCTPWVLNLTTCYETRTCTDLNECGDNRTKPAETQYNQTCGTCVESWSCGNWSSCSVCRANIFIDTRICTDSNNCNTTIFRPQIQRISTTGYLALFLLIIIALATLSIGLGFEVEFLPIIAGIFLIMVGGAMLVYQGTMLFSNWLAVLFILFGLGVILITTTQED